jgi:hypothetical protein
MKRNLFLVFTVIICGTFLAAAFISAKSGEQAAFENNCQCKTSLQVITKDLKADFGAKGNNKQDDSFSFLAASDWLNKNSSDSFILKLYIPPGTYLVGLQLKPGEKITNPLRNEQSLANDIRITRKGVNMMELENAKNIIISGSKRTVIKYKNGLPFGGYDTLMQPVSYIPSNEACSTTKDYNAYATLGTFIHIKNSSCITIEQIEMNGNNTKMKLGGFFGECNGYQIGHDGIDVFGSKNITVKNVTCNNFGRDGIMLCYSNGDPDCIHL